MELVPLPESKSLALDGAWTERSGGCDLNPFWFKRNPKFIIVPEAPTQLTITLKRTGGTWKRGTPLDSMVRRRTLGDVAHCTDGAMHSLQY